jgi:hypothetical protein
MYTTVQVRNKGSFMDTKIWDFWFEKKPSGNPAFITPWKMDRPDFDKSVFDCSITFSVKKRNWCHIYISASKKLCTFRSDASFFRHIFLCFSIIIFCLYLLFFPLFIFFKYKHQCSLRCRGPWRIRLTKTEVPGSNPDRV